jgi:hypothetical protein
MALTWCGWAVVPVGWTLNDSDDLSNPATHKRWRNQVHKLDAAIFGVECATLTRAREIPIPGHPHPLQLLRAQGNEWGLSNLSHADEAKVARLNKFIRFSLEFSAAMDDQGAAAALENPKNSWFWSIDMCQKLLKRQGWRIRAYHACAWFAAWAKA